jgi:hypothetical protein
MKTIVSEYGFFFVFSLVLLGGGILAFGVGAGLIGWILIGSGAFLILGVLYMIMTERRSRSIAQKQGAKVERVLYDPTFFDPQREFNSTGRFMADAYKKHWRQSYWLPHRIEKSSTWALLMPEIDSKAEYPNGWKLVVRQGEVTEALKQVIDEIARDELWKKSHVWLEIQSFPDRICALWDEGSPKVSGRLFDILTRLSDKTE